MIRKQLLEANGALGPHEKRALLTAACGGFWPEERRWRNGIRESAACEACGHEKADNIHRIHTCAAVLYSRMQWCAGGRTARIDLDSSMEDGLELLVCMGLPPVTLKWTPVDLQYYEGSMLMGSGGHDYDEIFGDGSGYFQDQKRIRIATWAINRRTLGQGEDNGAGKYEGLRGVVQGWFSTVPRGELQSLIEYLRHAGMEEAFISDCRYVVEGVRHGVTNRLTDASNINADLWREVRRLIKDRGAIPIVHKTKAHRSRTAAAQDADDPLRWWHGNAAADEAAKSLARSIAQTDMRVKTTDDAHHRYRSLMVRVALGTAWAYRNWPETQRIARTKADDDDADYSITPEERHVLNRSDDGRVECTICRKYALAERSIKKLRRERCPGSALEGIHNTHLTRCSAGIVWCTRCGAFMTRWPRRLLKPCGGRPATDAQRNVLRRLNENKLPTTAKYLNEVAVMHGGLGNGAPDYSTEVQWRRQPAARHEEPATGDEAGPIDGHDANGQQRAAVSMVLSATLPTGRYARLVGGALHRRADARDESTSSDGAPGQAGAAPRVPPARNAIQSQPRTGTASANACQPSDGTSWTRRLDTARAKCAMLCGVCQSPTRTSCRGCHSPLCIDCARKRAYCKRVPVGT